MKRDGLSNCLKYLSLRESEGPVLSRVEGCVAIRPGGSLRGEAEAICEIPRFARNDPSTRLRAGLAGQIAEPALSRAEGFHSQ